MGARLVRVLGPHDRLLLVVSARVHCQSSSPWSVPAWNVLGAIGAMPWGTAFSLRFFEDGSAVIALYAPFASRLDVPSKPTALTLFQLESALLL